jgi:hypothetical protein
LQQKLPPAASKAVLLLLLLLYSCPGDKTPFMVC